jgi:hypothetical protein
MKQNKPIKYSRCNTLFICLQSMHAYQRSNHIWKIILSLSRVPSVEHKECQTVKTHVGPWCYYVLLTLSVFIQVAEKEQNYNFT